MTRTEKENFVPGSTPPAKENESKKSGSGMTLDSKSSRRKSRKGKNLVIKHR